MNFLFRKTKIYLDYASTAPASPSVVRAMHPFWSKIFHNPNALYGSASISRDHLKKFRESVGRFFGAHSDEVIFTSGGTESDNLAILGTIFAHKASANTFTPHVIVSAIEHPAVLETIKFLEQSGEITASYISVDSFGVVSLEHFKKSLTPETILVSIMQVNNELGSIQPIQEIAKIVRHFKKHTLGNHQALYPLIHTDASQGVLYQETNIHKLGVDMLSCNGAKIYGPKGVGVLIKRRGVPLQSLVHGGNQEFGFRPGTQAVPLIAGIAKAFEELESIKSQEITRLSTLHDFFIVALKEAIPEITIYGSPISKVSGIVSVSYPNIESDLLVIELDNLGFELSSKSACKYDDPEESYVIKALGNEDTDNERGVLRISLGRSTTRSDLTKFIQALKEVVNKYKNFYERLEKKSKIV